MRACVSSFAAVVVLTLAAHACLVPNRDDISFQCRDAFDEPTLLGTVVEDQLKPETPNGKDSPATIRHVRVRVDETFWGFPPNTNEIAGDWPSVGFGCDFQLTEGEQYILRGLDPKQSIGMAVHVVKGDPLVKQLRSLRDHKDVAMIFGRIRKQVGPAGEDLLDESVAGIPINIVDAATHKTLRTSRTDFAGGYEIYAPLAGEVEVIATAPTGTTTSCGCNRVDLESLKYSRHLDLNGAGPIVSSANACVQKNFELKPDTLISGRVLLPDGSPAKAADVKLEHFEEERKNSYETKLVNPEGRFQFENIWPGRYWLSCCGQASGPAPYRQTFYPSAAQQANSQVITIAKGDHVMDSDIHVLSLLTTTVRQFQVVWKGGQPAHGAIVVILDSSGSVAPPPTDARGLVSLPVVRGQRLTAYAVVNCTNTTLISPNVSFSTENRLIIPTRLVINASGCPPQLR